MPIAKVIEVIAESEKGWEDAAHKAVKEAGESVRSIKHLYVEGMQAVVEDEKIKKFRLNAKITFLVDDNR